MTLSVQLLFVTSLRLWVPPELFVTNIRNLPSEMFAPDRDCKSNFM
jgi:hypothetical protein